KSTFWREFVRPTFGFVPALSGSLPSLAHSRGRAFFSVLQQQFLHRPTISRPLIDPVQKLGNAIDLIVVTPARKLEQFGLQIAEPGCLFEQVDLACLNLGRLSIHPGYLVTFG